MPTINSSTTIAMDGVTPISVGGTEYYQWFDQWLDGVFFYSPSVGPLLTVEMTGDWNSSILRASGSLGLRIADSAPGSRRLDAILCRNDVKDVISLTNTRAEIIDTSGGHDNITVNGDFWIQLISAGDGNDVVTLNSTNWLGTVNLGHGRDRLVVNDRGAGVEFIKSLDGNDTITVRSEADRISTGDGADLITTGANWIGVIDAGRGMDRVVLNKGGADYVRLGHDADTLIFKMQADAGHRVIVNGGGSTSGPAHRDSDTVNMAAFRVAIHADLDSGKVDTARGRLELQNIENLIGGSRNDVLIGNYDNNRLAGGAGRDVVMGGEGADTLIGGLGADHFRFRDDFDARADRVMDFRRGQGDKIDLRQVDANEGRGGDQRFEFIGQRRFSGDEGELRYVRANGETRILADTDGDRRAELTIILDDAMNMLMRDFFL